MPKGKLLVFRTARDKYMDDLALRISGALEGEALGDCALACASCIAYALAEMEEDEREKVKLILFNFINMMIEDVDADPA